MSARDVADGASLFVVGLFKKVALADYLALYVDRVYDVPDQFQAPALLLATFLFAWQIYFDFSGYTDMARGIGRIFGIRLMLNFNNPYLADGLGDFWKRWHISLSTWFRDYLYIPLGGNRSGRLATYRNMILTMLISGLWHGAAWTFVIWGALHALGRVVTRELEDTAFYRTKIPRFAISRIFTAGWSDPRIPLLMPALIAAVWGYQFLFESRLRSVLESTPVRVILVAAMFLYLTLFAPSGQQPFIYFQF